MNRRQTIRLFVLLIVGCVFGDTVVYNNEFLLFERTITLDNVSIVSIELFKDKPYIKFLITYSFFGNKYKRIPCHKILTLNDNDGSPIIYDCIDLSLNGEQVESTFSNYQNTNKLKKTPIIGGSLIALGGVLLYNNIYKECDDCETLEDSKAFNDGLKSTAKIGYAFIILGGILVSYDI